MNIWRRFDHTIMTEMPAFEERRAILSGPLAFLNPRERDLADLARLTEGLSGAAVHAAAFDIARGAVLSGTQTFHPPTSIQRLARAVHPGVRGTGADVGAEIRELRDWAPKIFTIRALSQLYSESTRQITKHLDGGDHA